MNPLRSEKFLFSFFREPWQDGNSNCLLLLHAISSFIRAPDDSERAFFVDTCPLISWMAEQRPINYIKGLAIDRAGKIHSDI